ncbi:MAG: hypothetical protein JSR61_15215 [Proteobacteria bacterium]|nr:hypothetical protein [Pseudomonadota bacterium]
MNRAKDYICFVVWFVGLSYMALWPLTVPSVVARMIAPVANETAAPLGCAGGTVASLQGFCQSHPALLLSPGLHLVGAAAALWVTARLMVLLLRRLLRTLLPKAHARGLVRQRLTAALRQRRAAPPSPPRWVRPRRDFGLRGGPH